MLTWDNYNGSFNFNSTPIGPMECPVIIHSKPSTIRYWDLRDRKGFIISPALNHYRCFHVADAVTKALMFFDTVEFMHDYLTQPTVSNRNCIFRALNFISCAVKDSRATIYLEELMTITKLQ